MLVYSSACLLLLSGSALATIYNIHDTYIGPSFLTGFVWETIPDPTDGRVTFVSLDTALGTNLTFTSDDTFIMRADYTNTYDASGPGRNSIRIHSNNTYYSSVTVLDLRHMPEGCGTWPAFWTTALSDWPTCGEIDIIEYVNNEGPNAETLHTNPGCTQPGTGRSMTGSVVTTDCDAYVNGNQGCSVRSSSSVSAGPAYNTNGGGWWAMERTTTSISIWFWPRNAAYVPASVLDGSSSVDTSTFGTPDSTFVNWSCDIPSYFWAHNIIFDLTLCGSWAGNVYPSTCPSDCIDYVDNYPEGFVNAYWDVASLRIYE